MTAFASVALTSEVSSRTTVQVHQFREGTFIALLLVLSHVCTIRKYNMDQSGTSIMPAKN